MAPTEQGLELPSEIQPEIESAASGGEPLESRILDFVDPRRWLESSGGRAIPLLVAIALVWIYFEIVTDGLFFSPGNVTNILVYTAEFGVVAIGVVVVLLLGEIDLSLGSLVGLSGCTAALVMLEWTPGAPVFVTMLVGVGASIAVGILCGIFTGFWVAVMKVPSFVVTLAGLLAFYGISLVITNSNTVSIPNDDFNALGASSISNFDRGYLATIWGSNSNPWHLSLGMIAGLIGGLGYTAMLQLNAKSRRKNGLPSLASPLLLLIGLLLTAAIIAVVEVLDKYEGVPIPVFILMVMIAVFSYAMRRTRFGRHTYATGGNAEAARRAGIPIQRVRWAAFIISGFTAGVGGVVFFARINGGSAGAVGSDYLLLVIASAVIGGTSLFGGQGSVWSALTGALMLASVQTGMGLTLASSTNSQYYIYIVEAGILLGAVWLDTFAKGRSTARGRT